MAVAAKNRPNFYVRSKEAATIGRTRDAELLGSFIYGCIALILFATACWVIAAQPLQSFERPPTQHEAGTGTIGNYAPVEHFPATGTGSPLVVDRSYRTTVR